MESEEGQLEEWEFEKCRPAAGPHGHTAITQQQTTGQKGFRLFYWECVECGERSKVFVRVRVDKYGAVL